MELLKRSTDETTHDCGASLGNTPLGFNRHLALGTLLIVGVAIALFTQDPGDFIVCVIGAVGVAMLAFLAVFPIRRYSRG